MLTGDKMKKTILIIVTMIVFSTTLFAQKKEFRKLENNAFTMGEKLTFDVKYGFITAGIAEMSIPRQRKISGRDVYHITFKVNSVPAFDPIFKVRDRYETYLDTEALIPWRFEQHIREGGFSKDYSAFFDHRRGKAKSSDGWFEIPDNVNDIVSAFYLARSIRFSDKEEGERIHLNNFFNNKVFPLDVVYHGKETIKTQLGTFETVIIEPLVVDGGLFKSEGNILIWLSDDDNQIPIKVKTKVVVGAIEAELTSYEGLAGELTSKID